MPISKFKATCLAALERVRTTGRPLLVTRRGEPIARVIAAGEPPQPEFGSMRGTARIVGDVVAPVADESEWESAQ